jgi:hypothetical protein
MNTRIVHSISSVLRTDGFVRNIHAANPFDVIRADVVLARIEKEAGAAAGCTTSCIRRACWAMRWIIWTRCR